jgi:NADH-quinone oxidoreductase subunit M
MFKSNVWYAAFAASGVILSACYMLWMFQRVFFGKIKHEENKKLLDLDWREKIILIPLVILIFWIGIYPKPFFSKIEPAVKNIIEKVGKSSIVENQIFSEDIHANLEAGQEEIILNFNEEQ